jgi:hypothetical protein
MVTNDSLPAADEKCPRGPRRLTINMSFSIASNQNDDAALNDLLSRLYGGAAPRRQDDQEESEEDREVFTSVDCLLGIKDSLTLVKCSPVGSQLSLNYDVGQGPSEGCDINSPTDYEISVETKKADTIQPRRRATRRMSIDRATRRVSIDMSIPISDGVDSELRGILSQLYKSRGSQGEEQDRESTNETSIEVMEYDVYELGIRRDSLCLVKCGPYRRTSTTDPPQTEEPSEELTAGSSKGEIEGGKGSGGKN